MANTKTFMEEAADTEKELWGGASYYTKPFIKSGVKSLAPALKGAGYGAALGSVVPGVGTLGGAVAGGIIGGAYGFGESLLEKEEDPNKFSVRELFRNGGIVKNKLINIEKGELEVNPETGEIIREFKMAPKHPKKGMKEEGNRYVKDGNAIIPAHKAKQYKMMGMKERMTMISELPQDMGQEMMQGGTSGLQPMQTYNPTMDPSAYYSSGTTSLGQSSNTAKGGGGGGGGVYFNPLAMGIGAYQWYTAAEELEKLGKQPLPTLRQYEEIPELRGAYKRAEKLTEEGYTPAERTAFESSLAATEKAKYKRGIELGGGQLAPALQSAITSADVSARVKFAADEAALRRRNIAYADSLARALQSQQNLQVQGQRAYETMLYNRRLLAEQSLGAAQRAGMENVAGSFYANIQLEDLAKAGAAIAGAV